MTVFIRECPYCGSVNTTVVNEENDFYKDTLHVMMDIHCDACGRDFVGEDQYELVASAVGKDPDDLYEALEESYKGE